MRYASLVARVAGCLLAGAVGSGAALSGCAASTEVKYTGSEYPSVPVEEVEVMGDQTPPGFAVAGVVTAACETLNGASGVLQSACTQGELVSLARATAAERGGHALVDLSCAKELLERRLENKDGGGVQATTRERLTCRATVVRWTKGGRRPKHEPASVASVKAGDGARRVVIDDIAIDLAFEPTAAFRKGAPQDPATVGDLEHIPAGYALLGKLSATCATTCAPRHSRAALRKEAAAMGGTALAAVQCEVAGADRWHCEASVIGAAVAVTPEPAPSSPEPAPAPPEPEPAVVADAAAPPDASADGG